MKKVRVGIVGGAGYTGGELLRLLVNHAGVKITCITSETFPGKKVIEQYPKLKGLSNLTFQSYQKQRVVEAVDFVFLAKPHPNSFAMVRELFGKVRIIDLSADFRFPAAQDFERAYQTKHLAPEFLKESVYGLPEIFPKQIKKAKLIANPGCYPTGVILAVFPLIQKGIIEPEINVSAISGFSGAGRSLSPDSPAYSVVDNIRPYKVGVHPHSAEMEEKIKTATGQEVSINFIPQVAGFERGILSVIFTRLKKKTSPETLVSLYRKTYRKCPFVRVCPQGQYPEIKNVVMTNFCNLGVQILKDNGLVIITAIDNLIKGAAGQAIQNLNIMAGFPEKEALQ
ncbi:MAG: N-acetyl-gamma-glutamyl-phosphate reductase [Candidatus Omnitrophica bacterium]|nr:N-acetyl-gamma-glutamyl-phosphate reductase [Candidatus Omnitrophota bacterium]